MTTTLPGEATEPALVPIAEYGTADLEFVSAVLDTCRRTSSTRIDIGTVDPGDAATRSCLAELADERNQHLYSLRLSCDLALSDEPVDAGLLRRAGVRVVALPAENPEGSIGGAEHAVLRSVATIALLQHATIAVTWHLSLDDNADKDEVDAVARLCSCLDHIPPPDSAPPRLQATVAAWRERHVPGTLTYSRGPGFVRVFDRRTPADGVSFVTLGGLQADVFLAALNATPIADLVEHADGVETAAFERFIDKLVGHRIMWRTSADLVQSLPTRRRMEERWVAGEF